MSASPMPARERALDHPVVEREAMEQLAAGLELMARGVRALVSARPLPQTAVPAPEAGWISPEAAAKIAGLPMGDELARRRSTRRIHDWARGAKWASRPNARTLLIDEGRFRAFLAGRAGAR